MNETDLAWLAGLLEGEGCFVFLRGHRPSGIPNRQWRVQLTMTDRDVVERAAALMDCRVCGPYAAKTPGGETAKPQWRTALGRRADVVALITALRPKMGERRQRQIDELLALHTSETAPYERLT